MFETIVRLNIHIQKYRLQTSIIGYHNAYLENQQKYNFVRADLHRKVFTSIYIVIRYIDFRYIDIVQY